MSISENYLEKQSQGNFSQNEILTSIVVQVLRMMMDSFDDFQST